MPQKIDYIGIMYRKKLLASVFPWKARDMVRHVWLIKHEPLVQKPLLVYFGGNAEDIIFSLEHLQNAYAKKYDILGMEYRGYGNTLGSPNEKFLVEDMKELLQHLISEYRYVAEDSVYIGTSLGSGVAAQVAKSIPPKGIILITPFENTNAVAWHHFPYLPYNLLNRNTYKTDDAVEYLNSHRPTQGLIIVGENDRLTLPLYGKKLAKKLAKSELVTVAKATHNTTWERNQKSEADIKIAHFLSSTYPMHTRYKPLEENDFENTSMKPNNT